MNEEPLATRANGPDGVGWWIRKQYMRATLDQHSNGRPHSRDRNAENSGVNDVHHDSLLSNVTM